MTWMRRLRAAAVAVGVCVLAATAGCSDDPGAGASARPPGDGEPSTTSAADPTDRSDSDVFPAANWERTSPEDAGFDPVVLDEIADRVEAGESNCFVVTRRGRIVAERYWNDTDAHSAQEVFSATKSVASTLIGLAQDHGDLDIDDPAAEYLEEWVGTPSEQVTVRDLLSNDSGREWSLQIDYGQLIQAADRTAFAVGLGQDHAPGEVWAYNNAAIQTLDAVLQRATDQPSNEFARQHLFDPIGMDDSTIRTDEAGNTLLFMGLQSTCEDMARFGHLFLREGRWNDDQVISAEWVEEATRPSQELTTSYGFLWWLNVPGPQVNAALATGGPHSDDAEGGAPEDGQIDETAPADMYWARGLGGQIVVVDPGSETVVVRLGSSGTGPDATRFDATLLTEVITRALTDP